MPAALAPASVFSWPSGTCTSTVRPPQASLRNCDYRPGKFLAAWDPKASTQNEQNIFTLATPHGNIEFKQIAGLIARRVVSWKKPQDTVAKGERIGLVRFGSRVDLWLPQGSELLVKVGDNVSGGLQHPGALARQHRGIVQRRYLRYGGEATVSMAEVEQSEIPFEGDRPRSKARARLRRGIFLLPAMMTSANLLCGYYAVVARVDGHA